MLYQDHQVFDNQLHSFGPPDLIRVKTHSKLQIKQNKTKQKVVFKIQKNGVKELNSLYIIFYFSLPYNLAGEDSVMSLHFPNFPVATLALYT